DVHSDKAGYFHSTPHDKGEFIRNKIVEVLQKCNIKYEKAHHEVTPSQHEINLEPVDPLSAADRTILFTYVTQKIAVQHGLYATFMPKPFDGLNRNALHIHLSMQDQSGENIFYDSQADCNLSQIARYFIGGILKYARETSIVMASTFNSYKAYIADREAPIVRGWGFRNRSSMVRVPYSISPANTRIELRNPDPGGNIYLQLAAYIAMGMQGIKEKLIVVIQMLKALMKPMRKKLSGIQNICPSPCLKPLSKLKKVLFLPIFWEKDCITILWN
ncbi:MAG: Glutamine synthetase, partial [Candidatus Magnetoglobus multicellularis str. Araruama]